MTAQETIDNKVNDKLYDWASQVGQEIVDIISSDSLNELVRRFRSEARQEYITEQQQTLPNINGTLHLPEGMSGTILKRIVKKKRTLKHTEQPKVYIPTFDQQQFSIAASLAHEIPAGTYRRARQNNSPTPYRAFKDTTGRTFVIADSVFQISQPDFLHTDPFTGKKHPALYV